MALYFEGHSRRLVIVANVPLGWRQRASGGAWFSESRVAELPKEQKARVRFTIEFAEHEGALDAPPRIQSFGGFADYESESDGVIAEFECHY